MKKTDKEATISNSVGSGIQYQRLNSNSGLLENEGDSAQQQNQLQVPCTRSTTLPTLKMHSQTIS